MNEYGFKSVFAKYMVSFLDEREARGFIKEKHISMLRSFDQHLVRARYSNMMITYDVYEQWLDTMDSVGYRTRYGRISQIRQFFDFLIKNGIPCVMPRLPRYKKCEYVPYIFTEEEMQRVFKESDNLVSRQTGKNTGIIAVPAIIRLLYSTGARIGEALSIRNQDIDFAKHVITLRETKNGRERFLPINPSLEAVLKQYIKYRNRIPIAGVEDPDHFLFINLTGQRVRPVSFVHWYKMVLEAADVIDTYNLKLPRIHDIRHTACLHVMHKMLENGEDLYCNLPKISAYMGHIKMSDTEYYLRMAQQYYPEMAKQQMGIIDSIKGIVNRALTVNSDGNV